MIGVSYSSSQLLSLLGRPAGAQPAGTGANAAEAVAELGKKVQVAQAVLRVAEASPKPSAPDASGSGTSARDTVRGLQALTYEQYEQRAEIARAKMAKLEAVEDAFEAENGWRRKATPTVIGAYNVARITHAHPIGSHEDAVGFASRTVSTAWDLALRVDRTTDTLADPAQVEQVAGAWGLSVTQAAAMLEDGRLAATLQATFESALFDRTFEVTGGPIMGQQDGRASANNIEVRWEGRLVLTVEGHGAKVTTYDEAGQARVMYERAGFAENQPGAHVPTTSG